MDVTSPAITYALLFIPTFFALTLIGQGVTKIVKEERDGPVAVGVGILLLVLIVLTYFLFIQ